MAKDYFIIEHEGHMGPHDEASLLKDYRDFQRFGYSVGMCMRIMGHDLTTMAAAASLPKGGPPMSAPEVQIARMDAAGIDVAMLVPHWHAAYMNVEPKGVGNDWVIETCEKYSGRLLPGPVFRPSIVGVKETLQEMEYLVKEKGVRYCKIYPPGELWDMSDKRYWPVYSLAEELGLTVAFHTGHGYIYGANTRAGHPGHLEEVAREFYDLKILAFHFGWPWQEELNCIAGAYPNVYIGISFLNNTVNNRPRFFAKLLGEALIYATVDKVIWSNDGVAQPAAVEGFRNFQFSQDLQESYGYKPLTTEDKAKMFGLNFAKLIGIEPVKRVD